MHPLISLISFIVFAAFVSLGQATSSIVGFVLLISVWAASRQLPAPKAWMMVKRLRIFFFSIFIMYLWFTPGELIWSVLDTWSPTYEGLGQGIQRITALIILVLGVESLLRLLDRSELLTGLYYLATPFQRLGIDRERFIIRILLTLEAASLNSPKLGVQKLHSGTEQTPPFHIKSNRKNINQYITNISQRLAEKFSAVVNHSTDIEEVVFEIKSLPHWIQWLIPITIAAIFIGLNSLFL